MLGREILPPPLQNQPKIGTPKGGIQAYEGLAGQALGQFSKPEDVAFDLKTLRNERNQILTKMLQDPRNFANTLYSTKKTGIIRRRSELFSPHLNLDDVRFCCLVDEKSIMKEGLPPTCYFTNVEQVNDGYEVKLQTQSFYLKIVPVSNLTITYSDSDPTNTKETKKQLLETCNYNPPESTKYLGSDPFTNEVLIGYTLNLIYEMQKDLGLNGVLKTYGATVCQEDKKDKKGVIFMEYVDGHSLNKFIKESRLYKEKAEILDPTGNKIAVTKMNKYFVVNLFAQLTANLHFMWYSAYFNHGGLITSSLSINTKERSTSNYQNLGLNSEFSIKIGDFSVAALTTSVQDGQFIRLYQRNTYAEKYLYASPFDPQIGSSFEQSYYKLGTSFGLTSLAKVRHMGIPFYSSFDLYTVLVSLLMIPEIYYTVFTDKDLKALFYDTMWFTEDISPVFQDITAAVQGRKPNDYNTVISILRPRKLKCNLLNDMITVLRKLVKSVTGKRESNLQEFSDIATMLKGLPQ